MGIYEKVRYRTGEIPNGNALFLLEVNMGKLNDLANRRYGRLTVIERAGSTRNKKALWKCKCDCGNEVLVIGSHLLNGNTKSCGCIKGTHNRTHGKSKTRLYHIWKNMRQRCNNENKPDYSYYGGRGITVCEEWNDYVAFQDWALSHGYADDLTIDRIDNDGNYEPNNCRWVSMTVQERNMSRNRQLSYNGETHCISEWGDIVGISPKVIGHRINVYGWSVHDALTRPVRRTNRGRSIESDI